MASDARFTKPSDEGFVRKGYHSPELRVYGDIRTLTQNAMMGMGNDSGSPPNGKTAV